MTILTKELLKDKNIFNDIIEKEKELVKISINLQKKLKNSLLDSMQRLGDSTDIIEPDDANKIVELLENYKNSLDISKTNISILKNILNMLDNIGNFENENLDKEIDKYNSTIYDSNKTILNNTLQIEETLSATLSFSEFKFFKKPENLAIKKDENDENTEKNTTAELPINEEFVEPIEITDKMENTLIISEQKGKVFLPYSLSLLNDLLKNNPDKYLNVEDIIEKEYTLPFELFKNPAFSRFRESFKLMRIKEKKSIKKSFDLGMELLFNYNLHPAIISACRNLDELDIYLDYLENNETHKFNCFKIIFDIAPIISKAK